MASRTASFGKRAFATAPPYKARPQQDALPDCRPASVIAAIEKQARPAPVAPTNPVIGFIARLPWFSFVLSYVLVARFHAETAAATDWSAKGAPGHFTLLAMGAVSRNQVEGYGEWWRLFTASALHGSTEHLVGNLIAFLAVGFLLEPMIGIGWFAAIYFTGGFAGALLSMLLNPPDMLSVGASGAIMATLAALFVLSFHTGAKRPNLMRRVAGALLFPALMPSVGHGAVTDINAHLGGALAGGAMAFLLLVIWHEDAQTPPGRSWAAAIAGLWVAMTVAAFAASQGTYKHYAADGVDYISPAEMPGDIRAMQDKSYALVQKYPRDPRAHLFRGVYFLQHNDASDAEPYLRGALNLSDKSPVMSSAFHDWTQALLAIDVRALGRQDEARTIAAPLCGRAELDNRTQQTLTTAKLCN